MEALAVIEKAHELGISLRADGGYIYYRPEEAAPPDFVELLLQNKPQLLRVLPQSDESTVFDLPFPIGYGGLPKNEVIAALGFQDARSITDPIERKLNVLMWLMGGMESEGDTGEIYQCIKVEYHKLRHADPTITDECGVCEYVE